jgi:regulator of sigma E protease
MSIILFILALSFLILLHELGHFLAAKSFGLLVEEFGIGFPPRLFSWKRGETRYSLNLLPFGGFVRIFGEQAESGASPELRDRSLVSQPVWKRAVVVAAGITVNFVLGWALLATVLSLGSPQALIVNSVAPDSPAALSGIAIGDRIVGYAESKAFVGFVEEHRGETVTLRLGSDADYREVSVALRENPPPGEGVLGITLSEVGAAPRPIPIAIKDGFIDSAMIIWGILGSLGFLVASIFQGAPALEGFVGPVGIFGVAEQTAAFGFTYLLNLIALISLNLTVLNALPIPALDGGRLLFLLIEKIKGSPLNRRGEMIANATGFALLILLMVAITVHDVAKLL